MYRLYWHPYTSSLAPMAVLEELGVPFELHRVDREEGETLTPEYLRLQPLGLIPALGLGDGTSMFESAAIVQYLCDRHGDSKLAPTPAQPDRPRYLQWLYFLADTIYPSYTRYYHPERYTADVDGESGVKEQARKAVLQQWKVIEDALRERGPYLLGEQLSACDIYLQMLTTWHDTPADLLGLFPNIRNLAEKVAERDGCQRAIAQHGFDTGLKGGSSL